jgi:hypothetical protein
LWGGKAEDYSNFFSNANYEKIKKDTKIYWRAFNGNV